MNTIKATTKISLVNPEYSSYRSSIPKIVVEALGISNGGKMDWIIEPTAEGYKVSVEKAPESE
jgi:hypothetical protein